MQHTTTTTKGTDLDLARPPDQNHRLSLCRILLAVTDILDVPRAFLEEAASGSRSLQLRYELLGQREVISLKNPLADAAVSSEWRAGRGLQRSRGRGGVSGGATGKAGRGPRDREVGSLVPLPVNHLR